MKFIVLEIFQKSFDIVLWYVLFHPFHFCVLNTSRRNEKNVSTCNEMSIQVSLVFPCRELLNAHRDNLGTTIKFVIFNELSNARNPNNMQILYTVLQHSSEQAPKVGAVSWMTDGNPRIQNLTDLVVLGLR